MLLITSLPDPKFIASGIGGFTKVSLEDTCVIFIN